MCGSLCQITFCPCCDLLMPSSLSLECLSPSQGFSVAGAPQGEMIQQGCGYKGREFRLALASKESWEAGRRSKEVPLESNSGGKAALWRHLFHCMSSLYFRRLLMDPSEDTPEIPCVFPSRAPWSRCGSPNTHTSVARGIAGLK